MKRHDEFNVGHEVTAPGTNYRSKEVVNISLYLPCVEKRVDTYEIIGGEWSLYTISNVKTLERKWIAVIVMIILSSSLLNAQMITGVWKGRINKQKVEVKIIQNGDNLTGTSYYYDGGNHFRRYSIKGYFDPNTNEAVWWDDQLIEEKTGTLSSPGKIPMLSRADFNCPGDGRMMLDGKASKTNNGNEIIGTVDLDKTSRAGFSDEWDYVIENFTVGANDPYIIDSIGLVSVPRNAGEEQPLLSIPDEENALALTEVPVQAIPDIKMVGKTVQPLVTPPG
ncbi:MAG: hypothetical protein EOO00_08355, partial [Chitinophagaceae bacterium]